MMDPQARKETLRMLSYGMYVMTARSGGHFGAATVTWLSQASFKPPLIMAALRRQSNVFKCLVESGVAAIHIVGSDQQDLAGKFFSPTAAADGRINGEPFTEGETAAPVLRNLPAYLECRLVQVLDGVGDHAVVILEVVEARCRRQSRPLTLAESPWRYGG